MRAAVRSEIRKWDGILESKSPRRFLRRGLDGCDDGYTLLICPTSQIVYGMSSSLPRSRRAPRSGRPATRARAQSRRGPRADFSDLRHTQVICPTMQVLFRTAAATPPPRVGLCKQPESRHLRHFGISFAIEEINIRTIIRMVSIIDLRLF